MSKDDLLEKATRVVHESDPEYLTLMTERVHKTVSMTAQQAAKDPKAVRAASTALVEAYWEQRAKLPFKTEDERAMAGPAIIAEMIAMLCIGWASSSLAQSVGEGIVSKPLIDNPETREGTIDALSNINLAIYLTLIKHCIAGLSKNKLHMTEIYEHFLPPEMRGKAH